VDQYRVLRGRNDENRAYVQHEVWQEQSSTPVLS
jgi:hypothetical protein